MNPCKTQVRVCRYCANDTYQIKRVVREAKGNVVGYALDFGYQSLEQLDILRALMGWALQQPILQCEPYGEIKVVDDLFENGPDHTYKLVHRTL